MNDFFLLYKKESDANLKPTSAQIPDKEQIPLQSLPIKFDSYA